jgi:hypothetical protein
MEQVLKNLYTHIFNFSFEYVIAVNIEDLILIAYLHNRLTYYGRLENLRRNTS